MKSSILGLLLAFAAGVMFTLVANSRCGPKRDAEIDSLIAAEKARVKIDSAVSVERQKADSAYKDSVAVIQKQHDSTVAELLARADSLARARGRTRGAAAGVETPTVPPRLREALSDSAAIIASLEQENDILRNVIALDTVEIRRSREESARAWARVTELEVESASKTKRINVLVKALEDVRAPCLVTSIGGSGVYSGGKMYAGPALHAGVRLGCIVDLVKR